MPVIEETYDVVVVGAGHAGCEASLAAARRDRSAPLFCRPSMPPCRSPAIVDIVSKIVLTNRQQYSRLLGERSGKRG